MRVDNSIAQQLTVHILYIMNVERKCGLIYREVCCNLPIRAQPDQNMIHNSVDSSATEKR